MSKRARSGSSSSRNKAKLKALYKPGKARAKSVVMDSRAPMYKQLKGLLAAKTRDNDTNRNASAIAGGSVYSYCLTSGGSFGVAPSGSGLLDCDADEVLINTVRLRGVITHPAVAVADRSNAVDSMVRRLIVWYNKPLRVADADGTLPPITEIMPSAGIHTMIYQNASNGGRFVILSDRTWNLGTNLLSTNTSAGTHSVDGHNTKLYDYTVKVGRKVKFVEASASGASAGGHYDSDVAPGRVATGLLVCYTIAYSSPAQVLMYDQCTVRMNYTG